MRKGFDPGIGITFQLEPLARVGEGGVRRRPGVNECNQNRTMRRRKIESHLHGRFSRVCSLTGGCRAFSLPCFVVCVAGAALKRSGQAAPSTFFFLVNGLDVSLCRPWGLRCGGGFNRVDNNRPGRERQSLTGRRSVPTEWAEPGLPNGHRSNRVKRR